MMNIKNILQMYGLRIFIIVFCVIDIFLVCLIIHYRTASNVDTMTVNSNFENTVDNDDELDMTSSEYNINLDDE